MGEFGLKQRFGSTPEDSSISGDKVGRVTTPMLVETDAHEAWGLEKPGLGLALGGAHHADQVDRNRAWAVLADSLGLHSAWLPEMHFAPGVCPTPLLALADLVVLTKRLRLGTTSLLLPLHPPEKMAAEIAGLDRLSGGRLLIGLGRGFQKKMLEAFGVDPTQKRDRFDEALDCMLALWSEGNAQENAFATRQLPHPPLAVAAFGPKGLAQAARRGLPYLASPVEAMDQLEQNQARHRELLPESSPAPLSIAMRTIFVSESENEREAARKSLEAEFEQRGPRMPAAVSKALESPLENRVIVGSPTEVHDRLQMHQARLGLDLLIVRPGIGGVSQSAQEDSLRWLAQKIWPDIVRSAAPGPAVA